MALGTGNTPSAQRLYFLDWLRVIAIIGVFLFHNARIFDIFTDWQVKNAATSTFISFAVIGFMNEWLMPLFFLISGAGTFFAFRSRNAVQYVFERSLRLFVPLIFGMLVIVPPQAYYEAANHGLSLNGNLVQLYPQFLKSLPSLPWYHLWFLAYLFVFSLVAIPLIAPLGKRKESIITRIASRLNQPWILLPALVISIAAVNILLNPGEFWGDRNVGNWNIPAYLLFFIWGYLIFSNTKILEIIKKIRWVSLATAAVGLACMIIIFLDVLVDRESNFGSAMFAASQLTEAVTTWGLLLAFIGFGNRFLNFNNRFLLYANQAVLPFYILHQTVIVSIGFYVVQWNTGIGIKYLAISTSSFVVIMIIYESIVRRINAVRFLFGMRWLGRNKSERV
jgi:glucans biosynthesis protein C